MIYSAPYILLIGFYGSMAWWYQYTKLQRNRTWITIACITLTLLFWGFRGFIFYDWMSYYPTFLELNLNDVFNSKIWTIEPGFALLMTTSKAIFNNWHFFVFLCTCINLALLTRFILRHIENFPLGLMIYTAIGGLFLMTDLMRNAFAILIFINSIDYIKDRKPIKYYLLCLLSISFHYSSALYLPLYFFLHKNINRYVFAAIFFIGCIIFALHIPLFTSSILMVLNIVSPELETKIRFYILEVVNQAPGIDIVFIERVFTGTLILCFYNKLHTLREDANIFINSILLYFSLTFYLSEFVTLSMRMALLFSFGYWVIWTDLINCFSIKNNRKLFVLFVAIYCMLRIYGLTKSVLADYDNIIFKSERFQQRESIFNKNYKDL